MLIGERMSRPVLSIPPDMPIHDFRNMFKQENIRRAPVVKKGKMIGIVSDQDIINASPSMATSLSVWELTYLLSKIQAKDVMTKDVLTIDEDTPIEQAARLMADNKIGGLPVMRDDRVVGMITETDLFKVFLELMGARDPGVRVTALVDNKPGVLQKITGAISEAGGNFLSLGIFTGEDVSTNILTFKVDGIEKEVVKKEIWDIVKEVWDIRE